MTKRILKAFTLTSVCASFLLAQGPGGTPPTPAEMVARQVERLTSLLTLTTAQQSQATTIFTAAQTAIAPLQTSMQTARTALQAAIPKNDTATIATEATQIGNLTAQLAVDQAKAEAAFYLILTADQQTKYSQALTRGGGRGGFGGPGGPGGFGGQRPGRGPGANQ
jgi:Spy/CpxP family protein refolding chaperone